jgi:NCS2 family nucleobase:cation symporter-2/xanthine permease
VPDLFSELPPSLRMLVSDGVITGSLTAILMNLFFNFRTILAPSSIQHEEDEKDMFEEKRVKGL